MRGGQRKARNHNVRPGPSSTSYYDGSLPPLEELNTIDVPRTPLNQRGIMIHELKDCFKRATLENSAFYEALLSGSAIRTGDGVEGCHDIRTVQLINKHPVPHKRRRLIKIFTQYQNGENVTEISSEDEEEETTAKATKRTGTSVPRLDDVVPYLEKDSVPRSLLDQMTRSRFLNLDNYFTTLRAESRSHPRLQHPESLKLLEDLMTAVNFQSNTLLSIDIEAHEFNQNTVTEIGISIYDPTKEATSLFPNLKNIHILPEEYVRLRNGSFVADNKDKFLGGNSVILPMKKSIELVQCLIDYYFVHREEQDLHGVLVGHNVGGDVKWLKNLGVTFPEDMQIVDTQTLYGLTHGQNNSSLGAILRRFDIPHAYLHNAGNDAYYTLMLALKLGDPQFRRWQGVDSFKEDEIYLETLEERKSSNPDPFLGSRVSKPRNARVKKSNEVVPPVRYSTSAAALEDLFRPVGIKF